MYPDFGGGCDYYYDTHTGVTTWTRPADLEAPDDGTYASHLHAGGRGDGRHEGGGSKELYAGSTSDGDIEAGSGDDSAVALCNKRKQPPVSEDSGAPSQKADTSGGPALVWVPIPSKSAKRAMRGGKKRKEHVAAKKSGGGGSGGGGGAVAAVPATAGKTLQEWTRGVSDDEAEGDWLYHTYEREQPDGAKVSVVAKWVVRRGTPAGYTQLDGTNVVQADLLPVTLGALRAETPDLTQLDSLDDPLIVFQLQQRFAKQNIYTKIGPIVVSINPLVPLPDTPQEECVLLRSPNSCSHRRVADAAAAQARAPAINSHGSA